MNYRKTFHFTDFSSSAGHRWWIGCSEAKLSWRAVTSSHTISIHQLVELAKRGNPSVAAWKFPFSYYKYFVLFRLRFSFRSSFLFSIAFHSVFRLSIISRYHSSNYTSIQLTYDLRVVEWFGKKYVSTNLLNVCTVTKWIALWNVNFIQESESLAASIIITLEAVL